MNEFNRIVMITAIVILIICLILIAVALHGHKTSNVFPPIIGDCPDYWEASPEGCDNIYNLGNDTAACQGQNFDELNTGCIKQQWARKCNLTWDGITNNADLCS